MNRAGLLQTKKPEILRLSGFLMSCRLEGRYFEPFPARFTKNQVFGAERLRKIMLHFKKVNYLIGKIGKHLL